MATQPMCFAIFIMAGTQIRAIQQFKDQGNGGGSGKTFNFPEVADRISDLLHSERLTIEKVIEVPPIGNRAEVNRWVKECASVFDGLLHESRYSLSLNLWPCSVSFRQACVTAFSWP